MYTHENNGPSYLSPQCLCGNSCIWSHEDMKSMVTHCCTNEPKTTFIHTRKFAIYKTDIVGHLMIG